MFRNIYIHLYCRYISKLRVSLNVEMLRLYQGVTVTVPVPDQVYKVCYLVSFSRFMYRYLNINIF